MARHFALTVHLYDRRYHGAGEWPPAPARVFQALVAGAAQGRCVPYTTALELLERLPPPVIGAPQARRGQRVTLFVPNNDLDAVGGDPDRVGEVRTKKTTQPQLLESAPTFLYAWPLLDADGRDLIALADGLYQLGRGVDPAWAVGEVLDDEQLASRLRVHRGTIHRPTSDEGTNELAVPTRNSLKSIVRRFDAALIRLRPSGDGRTNFVQPPKAHFSMVRYDGTPPFHLFELRRESEPTKSSRWATRRATAVVEHVRDVAVAALSSAFPERAADIERVLVGRKSDGANAGPISERVRFIPLPSIGHEHADLLIRRVLVQVPPGPLAEDDILWALSGRSLFNPETGEVYDTTLSAASADEMVRRYSGFSRIWRSVTPLVLGPALRRRIEPKRQREEAKSGAERVTEERTARHAVVQALRQAGIEGTVIGVQVQREPFTANGVKVEEFAPGTRFAKERLWHVEITFKEPVRGPLVIGDGRFLGLGVMEPVRRVEGVHAFVIREGVSEQGDVTTVTRALRRAVMSRVQEQLGQRTRMPVYFSGHERDGMPSRKQHQHLTYVFDAARSVLLVLAPHVVERRGASRDEAKHLKALDAALVGFRDLRAGTAGHLSLEPTVLGGDDPLLASSRTWETLTPYVVTKHAKKVGASEALAADLRAQCRDAGLPVPDVEVRNARGVPGVGLVGNARLTFKVAVAGPISVGRDRHFGGGLFTVVRGS